MYDFSRLFFASFLILLILSTAYEVRCNIAGCKKNQLLCAFSVYTNSKIIMTTKPMLPNEMIFLHGIRSLAIIWIVLGHTYALTYWMTPSMNGNLMLDSFKNFEAPILFSGYFAVDTFFMLSSLLLSLSVFRELDKT